MKGKRGKSSPRTFYIALGALALLGAVALIYIVTRPPAQQQVTMVDPSAVPGTAEPYILGDTTAPVTIMEFADFQCGWCAQYAIVVEPDVKRNIVDAGLAQYHFYPFPLEGHQNAWPAAHAAACAGEQNQFWPMHGLIFQGQNDWATRRNPKSQFESYARAVPGLDVGQWETCYDERRYQARIQASLAEGTRRGVSSTPTFIIGNRMLPGMQGYDAIRAWVDSARANAGVAAPAGAAGAGSAQR